MAIVIPQVANETAEVAQARFSAALAEQDTTFLLFRSTTATFAEVEVRVKWADDVALENPAEWRVMWIQNDALLKPADVERYFGSDPNVICASLRLGTGEPREVVERFSLPNPRDPIATLAAFSKAWQ